MGRPPNLNLFIAHLGSCLLAKEINFPLRVPKTHKQTLARWSQAQRNSFDRNFFLAFEANLQIVKKKITDFDPYFQQSEKLILYESQTRARQYSGCLRHINDHILGKFCAQYSFAVRYLFLALDG